MTKANTPKIPKSIAVRRIDFSMVVSLESLLCGLINFSRKNARTDRGPPERRNSVIMFKMLGEREWSGRMGYGRRWAAETAFSTFKRLYGEHSMAKNMGTIAKELAAKAYIYNMLINLQS